MVWSGVLESKACTLAVSQHGVASTEQLKALGISRRTITRRVKAKVWSWVFPGVLKLLPPPREAWLQKLKAAQLWLGEEHTAVSHRAAAKLWALDGVEEEEVEISTTSHRNGRKVFGVTIHRVSELKKEEVQLKDGFRVTTPARTLQDLAGILPKDKLDSAMDCILRCHHATLKVLKRAMNVVRRHFPGRRMFAELLEDIEDAGPTDSEAERLFVRDVIDRYKLPRPERNVEIFDGEGNFVARPDGLYKDLGIVIEIYSRKHHGSAEQIMHDTERMNRLVTCGLYPLIFWWHDVRKKRRQTAMQIKEARAKRMAALGISG